MCICDIEKCCFIHAWLAGKIKQVADFGLAHATPVIPTCINDHQMSTDVRGTPGKKKKKKKKTLTCH